MPSDLIAPAGSMVAVYVKGKIYMCGGMTWDDSLPTQPNCVIFEISTNLFTAMAPLPIAVNSMAYATDGSNIFVIGGRRVSHQTHSC